MTKNDSFASSEAARVLGVGVDADEAAVDSAFREAALRHHPDCGGDPADLQRVVEARDVLRGRGSSPAPGRDRVFTRRRRTPWLRLINH